MEDKKNELPDEELFAIVEKEYNEIFKKCDSIEEKNEEKVIKSINKTYESFMKFSSRKTISKLLNKKGESKLDLPQIKFEKIITQKIEIKKMKKFRH